MQHFSVIVNYNTMSLNQISAQTTPERSNMKTQINDRFGSGLLVLVMLTVAVVASEAEPGFQNPEPAVNAFELNADFRIAIDQERLEQLKSLSSVIDAVLDLPIEVSLTLDESGPPAPDRATAP